MSPTSLTQADLRSDYDQQGLVFARGLLASAEVDELRVAFTEQIERDRGVGYNDGVPEGDPLAQYPRIVHPHRLTDLPSGKLARQWMLSPRILDIVTTLIGAPLAAQSMFYFKPPGSRGQALHQDNLFLRSHPETCLAAWIAVDDCDIENGGLAVVPGTHRYELQCLEEADVTQSFVNATVRLADDMEPLQTTMAAGDVLFFHGSLVHGSGPNHSADRFRRSLIFHYVPQSSVEVAAFYHPLLTPAGDEVVIDDASGGGACGNGWQPNGGH